MTEIKHLIAANRAALADALSALPAARWDEPTLCAGWRAREVVAHITMPFRYSGPRFLAELARNRFRFTAMSDRVARRDATVLSPAALAAALASNAGHPWKPPGGGLAGALTHDTIHGLDIAVPLRLGYVVPPSVWEIVLPGLAQPRTVRYFGTDLTGVTLRASDLDWSYGSGASVVTGTAADLALLMCGRKLPPLRLAGERSDRFTAPAGRAVR